MSQIEILDSNPNDEITIKGYKIKERIGVGSYGRVYKVLKKDKYYVLKEIPLNLSSAAEKINSVQNEAEILSSLNNKYIVKFYESFKMNQNIYIIMEYCDNGDLCTFLNKVKKTRKDENYYLDEDFVWKLFIQMSIGLFFIHSKKIIHRDIKTINIFLTKNLDAKIGDLGVAKILEDTNHANTFIGTPYYVSPEMCKNKPYNEKSDIWALGCILYELLTFNHPFTATNQAALFIKILNNNFNPFPPGTPEDLKYMVEFILQKDSEQRPSMEEIINSYYFQLNAIRIGLEDDLKQVLEIDKLPIYNLNKNLNNNNINTSHTFIIQINKNKNNNKEKENHIKSQKSGLNISRSVNPLNSNGRNYTKISSKNNIVKKNYIIKNKKSLSKNNNKDIYKANIKNEYSTNQNFSHIRLLKNNDFPQKDEIGNKRTKSDINYKEINSNSAQKENVIKSLKKAENKNTIYNKEKKYTNLNSILLLNSKKNNISPGKTKFYVNNKTKLKDYSEKNINNLNNNHTNSSQLKTNSKTKIIKFKEKYNYNNLNSESSLDKKIRETKSSKKMNNLQKEIKINDIISEKIKKNCTLMKKEFKDNSRMQKESNEKNTKKSDIITESDFMAELNNTIKNTPMIITLNDLLYHNFNDDSKNLNTTSATTSLGKIEFPTITAEEMVEINRDKVNLKENQKSLKNVEEERSEIFNGSCDEFTHTEMIKRCEPYLSHQIPFSNYEIKINENKKEIKHIVEMPKDELMKTSLLYKDKYEQYLEKFKKYSHIIDINEVHGLYKNINNLNDKEIKIIFNSIVNYVKKKVPQKDVDELVDILYNLLSYEIKYKVAEKTIKKA